MNARARISSKGQLVVPKSVRDEHGWGEGTELEFVESGAGVLLQQVAAHDPRFPPITWEEFMSRRIRTTVPFPTDEEIDQTMLAEAARKFDEETGG